MNQFDFVLQKFFYSFQVFHHKDPKHDVTKSFYVHRATNLRTYDGAQNEFDSPPTASRIDPFIFLTGLKSDLTNNYYEEQEIADPPFLSLVVGQYGTGKSEMSYRLCEFLRGFQNNESEVKPLPINLSFFRDQRKLLNDDNNCYKYFDTLFLRMLSEFLSDRFPNDKESLLKVIKDQIQQGKVMLILDALDEVIDDPHQHRNFFAALREFLDRNKTSNLPEHEFRIVVTMRREYLSAVSDLSGRSIIRNFNCSFPSYQIYFLELDQFNEWEIEKYFKKRVPDLPNLFSKVAKNSKLLSTLQRPLLLKLFTDLAPLKNAKEKTEYDIKREKEFKELFVNVTEEVQLISEYVNFITRYVEHAEEFAAQEQKNLKISYVWDNNKLAKECIQLYKKRSNVLDESSIRRIRSRLATFNHEEDPFLSIYKCPFLLRIDRQCVRFAHRVFFEFFTAKGLVLEVEKKFDQSEEFNTLVLNPDMRKFLKFMLNTNEKLKKDCIKIFNIKPTKEMTVFRMISWRSCGMRNPEEWEASAEFDNRKNKLDSVRFALIMTDPEERNDKLDNSINWFLENEDTHLHPKYLMYCHDAVAMHIYHSRWSEYSKQQNKDLSERLKKRIDTVIQSLEKKQLSDVLIKPSQLLVERILDIGLRMRYEWINEYTNKAEWLNESKWDFDSNERINKILKAIQKTLF